MNELSREEQEELRAALSRFRELDDETRELVKVIRKYMKVEWTWVFYTASKEERGDKNG